MGDTFLLGAGFSKAVCRTMPTMNELFELLEPLIDTADGISRDAYDYASGNVETLLSYYAIPSPSDDPIEVLRKQGVTASLEREIGRLLSDLEATEAVLEWNPNGEKLVDKWHQQQSHVLTANYDTLVERIANEIMSDTTDAVLYPISVIPASARGGHNPSGTVDFKTFTLYKLHGSVSWYTSAGEGRSDPIYASSYVHPDDPGYQKLVGDKRRFIAPPVHDKSTLLSHESVRNLWWQAKNRALAKADRLYVVGYSLPGTDMAMRTLLWEARLPDRGEHLRKIPLYVVNIDRNAGCHYEKMLGNYYDVIDTYAGGENVFDRFVEEYTKD